MTDDAARRITITRVQREERAKRLLADGKRPVTREEAERSARTASRLEAKANAITVLPADGWLIEIDWPADEGPTDDVLTVIAWEVRAQAEGLEYVPVVIDGEGAPVALDRLSEEVWHQDDYRLRRA